jgi:lactate permease
LEGGSGFGSPAAICAPLLVGLGFPPMAAVVLSLTSNSFPVVYGSVGTTIFVGLGQGLQQGGNLAPIVAEYLGSTSVMDYLQLVSIKSALLMWLPATLIPLLLSVMLTRFWGENKSWKEGLGIWKFALFTGFTYATFTLIIAILMGPEFPTIIGSMLTMVVMVTLAKKGILLPEKPWFFHPSAPTQLVVLNQPLKIPTWKALTPYLLVTIILLITRLRFLPFLEWLNIPQIGWTNILGTEISTQFAPLYSPGAIFTFTAIISLFLLKLRKKEVQEALKITSCSLITSLIALSTAIPMVRIFINSGVNGIQLGSMPVELATSMAATFGSIWPLVAPFVGSLGAFISGSATISNLMFSLFQFGVALENQLDPVLINALQIVGATVGKMICIVSVVAASSVVNLQGNEGRIIRYTLLPSLVICLIVGLIALLLF